MPFRWRFGLRRTVALVTPTQPVPEETAAPFSSADDFLDSLPKISPEDLSEEDRNCAICQNEYNDGSEPEAPVKLPCGHYMGASCVSQWFSPTKSNKNTCPLCREAFFELPDEDEEGEEDEDEEPETYTFMDMLEGDDIDFGAVFDLMFPLLQNFQLLREDNLDSMTGQPPRSLEAANYFRVSADQPILISSMVQSIFQAFSRDASAVSWEDTSELKILLGQLALCFSDMVESLESGLPWLPWYARGPKIDDLRDPACYEKFTAVLEKFIELEEHWYTEQMLHIERGGCRCGRDHS